MPEEFLVRCSLAAEESNENAREISRHLEAKVPFKGVDTSWMPYDATLAYPLLLLRIVCTDY